MNENRTVQSVPETVEGVRSRIRTLIYDARGADEDGDVDGLREALHQIAVIVGGDFPI